MNKISLIDTKVHYLPKISALLFRTLTFRTKHFGQNIWTKHFGLSDKDFGQNDTRENVFPKVLS